MKFNYLKFNHISPVQLDHNIGGVKFKIGVHHSISVVVNDFDKVHRINRAPKKPTSIPEIINLNIVRMFA